MHRGIALLLRFGHVQGWSYRLQQQIQDSKYSAHVQYRAVAYPTADRYGTAVISQNQMCATGEANSMCPIRSRRTFSLCDFNATLLTDNTTVF